MQCSKALLSEHKSSRTEYTMLAPVLIVTLVGVPGRVTTKVLGDLINTAPSHLLVRHTRGYVLGGETTAASLLVCPVV